MSMGVNPMPPQVENYIRAIRNNIKRAYAYDYAQYLLGKRRDAPMEPTGLSYMARQAVRMQLHELIK
jgi:hypothetical protein